MDNFHVPVLHSFFEITKGSFWPGLLDLAQEVKSQYWSKQPCVPVWVRKECFWWLCEQDLEEITKLTMNYHRLTCLIEKGPDIDAGGFRQLHWDPRGDGRGADGKVDWENTDTLLAMSDILLRPLQESEAVSLARTTARPRGGKRKSLGRLIWTTVQSKLIPNPWFGLSRS